MINEGQAAPDFICDSSNGSQSSLKTYSGKHLIIYFYPKDNTPGCTKEAVGFSDLMDSFSNLDAHVIGVSKDSIKSHTNFCKKHDLKVELLSDPDGKMIEAYGAWQEKSMYGKTYMGIQRSTIWINKEGIIEKIWPKVKVNGHAEEVLTALGS